MVSPLTRALRYVGLRLRHDLWRLGVLLLGLCTLSWAQEWPETRAESSNYTETSSHSDVMEFLGALADGGANFQFGSLGQSVEGRDVPLVVVAEHPHMTPHQARREGKIVVYVQANIHGGEVEGKEVSLALLRHIAQGEGKEWLKKMVLLVAPIYNSDGNDNWGEGDKHRPNDNGPDRVGTRPNGQGLDLNRDCMKAESPEMRGVLRHVYKAWDPEVIIDLHTTNGTRHGFQLTYSPPLAPDTAPGVLAYTRDELLPGVRARLQENSQMYTFPYGNARPRNKPSAWHTFEPHPRYVTNYAGIRNRIGILSEATSYLTFQARCEGTRLFLWELLDSLARDAERVRQLIVAADREVASWGPTKALGVRFTHKSRGIERIRLEDPAHPKKGAPTDIVEVELEIYDRFEATHTRILPRGYLFGGGQQEVIDLLRRHGVRFELLRTPRKERVEVFRIEALNSSEQLFQGHRLHRLQGTHEELQREYPAGTIWVPMAQPLALLAFHLLEAESLDGVGSWGLLDRVLKERSEYPIVRVR